MSEQETPVDATRGQETNPAAAGAVGQPSIVLITPQLAQKILAFLGTQPWAEVNEMLVELLNATNPAIVTQNTGGMLPPS